MWEDNVEYSCQTTSNCLHNQTTHCLGETSSTKLDVQFPPRNINISQQVEIFSSLFISIIYPLILTISIYSAISEGGKAYKILLSHNSQVVELVEFSPFPSLYCVSDGEPRPTYRQERSVLWNTGLRSCCWRVSQLIFLFYFTNLN